MSKRHKKRSTARRRAPARPHQAAHSLYRRALRYEPLEDRRLLAVVTVDTLADTVDFNDGHTSLREAIFATNTVPGADTINFAPELTARGPATILLTQGELKITDALTINGPGANLLIIDASGNDSTPGKQDGKGTRVFNINDGTSASVGVALSGLTLTGGDIGGQSGGAILSQENLSVANCTISGNFATLGGGGIYTRTQLSIDHSVITNNTARYMSGGGIYSNPLSTSPASLTITDSAITNNTTSLREGGGIRKRYGDLTIERSNISNNKAWSAGAGMSIADGTFAVKVADSEITGNSFVNQSSLQYGGGVFVTNGNIVVTIERSQISGNSARRGGGIHVTSGAGAVTVQNSQISGNSATIGGGILVTNNQLFTIESSTICNNTATSVGAAIYGGNLLVSNTTISNNTGGPGALVFTRANIQHSTIVNNSGGFGVGRSTLEVGSSIIVGNANADVTGTASRITSDGYNIIGNAGTVAAAFNQPGDQVAVTDAMLAPLADNGGTLLPDGTHILTRALLPGSPAINAGDLSAVAGVNGVPQFDERGTPFPRIFGGRIDIGAFEYQQPSDLNLVVDALVDESDGNYTHGDLSLREAIKLANMYSGPNYPGVVQSIHFDPALAAAGPAIILLKMGDLKITGSIDIEGISADLLTIDASGNDPTPSLQDGKGTRVFSISDGAVQNEDVTISKLTLTGGDVNDAGGAVRTDEPLNLNQVVIRGNSSGSVGGGLYAAISGVGNLNISSSRLEQNMSHFGGGGGIAIELSANATVELDDTSISMNSSLGTNASGGGLRLNSSSSGGVLIESCEFANNTTKGTAAEGGGAYLADNGAGYVTVTDSHFSTNHTSGTTVQGGGAYIRHSGSGDVTIFRNEFSANSTQGTLASGGGVYVARSGAGISLIDSNNVHDNTSQGTSPDGGGIGLARTGSGTATISNNTLTHNASARSSLYASAAADSTVTIFANQISNNLISSSSVGLGGISTTALAGGVISIQHNFVTGCSTGITVTGAGSSDVTDNTATGNQGIGIDVNGSGGGNFHLGHNLVSFNQALGAGGGLFLNAQMGAQIIVDECLINNNVSHDFGGGGIGVFVRTAGLITVKNSAIAANTALIGPNSLGGNGGGVWIDNLGGQVNFDQLTIERNFAKVDGGGIWNKSGFVAITRSTISNNTAAGNGGGVAAVGPVIVVESTIGQNSSAINGGGIWSSTTLSVQSSTIFANRAGQIGGGVFLTAGTASIIGSIIAANAGLSAADLSGLLGVTLDAHYSLIGSNQGNGLTPAPVGSPDVNGNLIGGSTSATVINPQLLALAMNGGPTATYEPQAGSPVINTGDPSAAPGVGGVPPTDQRGVPYTRKFGGRIDIGAFEVQPPPIPGDFTLDGIVNAADYVVWRNALTTYDPRADANGDGRVDDVDLAVWRSNFGNTYASMASTIQAITAVAAVSQSRQFAPSRMMADLAVVEPVVDSPRVRIAFSSPTLSVLQPASRHASSTPSLSAAEELTSSDELLNLTSANARSNQRTTSSAAAHINEQDAFDCLSDSADSDSTAVDEAFATLGARKLFTRAV